MKNNNLFKLSLLAFSVLGIAGCSHVEPVENKEQIIQENEDIVSHGVQIQQLSSGVDANNYPYQVFSYTLLPSTTTLKTIDASLSFADNRQNGSSYLTYEINEEAKTVKVTCLQAFDSVATLTLTSHFNLSAYASVTIRYLPKRTLRAYSYDLDSFSPSSFNEFINTKLYRYPGYQSNQGKCTIEVSPNTEGEASTWLADTLTFSGGNSLYPLTCSQYQNFDATYSSVTEKQNASLIMNSYINSSIIENDGQINGHDFAYWLTQQNNNESRHQGSEIAKWKYPSSYTSSSDAANWAQFVQLPDFRDIINEYYSTYKTPSDFSFEWIQMCCWAYGIDFTSFINAHGNLNTGKITFTWDLASVIGLDSRFGTLTATNSNWNLSGEVKVNWSGITFTKSTSIDSVPTQLTPESGTISF